MPVEFKDYYATLGVARDATQDQIKSAFRKLAREFHPDVAKDKKTAEARFKEINEAYEVLGDPDKRAKYDRLGSRWNQPGGPGPWPGSAGNGFPGEEVHFEGTGFSDFFEQFFARRGDPFEDYETFGGGEGRSRSRRGSDVEADLQVTLDEIYSGNVREITMRRVDSRTGRSHIETHKVRLPRGLTSGQRIRLRGKGEAGAGGAASGDLILRVIIAPHPDFRVEGHTLLAELPLAPWEAVLGTQLALNTPRGPVTLKVPPGCKNGQRLRVRGRGLPKGSQDEYGDLLAEVIVETPAEVSAAERELWEKLARTSTFHPRR